MPDEAILWRRHDVPGHEAARLMSRNSEWTLGGTAIFLHEGQPCRLDYSITCDSAWLTQTATVSGWIGRREVSIDLQVRTSHRWWLNGVEAPQVAGCIDLDLNFSPSTNLLPIRRLSLAIGHSAEVQAAWLRFPQFELEPLHQTYRRIGDRTYRYESAGGSFVRDLEVTDAGFVAVYPGFWSMEP
jgi:hypothetical protein